MTRTSATRRPILQAEDYGPEAVEACRALCTAIDRVMEPHRNDPAYAAYFRILDQLEAEGSAVRASRANAA